MMLRLLKITWHETLKDFVCLDRNGLIDRKPAEKKQ